MDKDLQWDGVVESRLLDEAVVRTRHVFADDAKHGRWDRIAATLKGHPGLINSTRLDSDSRYTALHQAAYLGATPQTIEALVAAGAWRTLLNNRGERPVDVAVRQNNRHLSRFLEPVLRRSVPTGILHAIRDNFHNVIRGRIRDLDDADQLRLPELEPLLEFDTVKTYFGVPGMYGGFSYWLENDGIEATLIAESWCRVVEGSGQRHAITSVGAALTDEGFV